MHGINWRSRNPIEPLFEVDPFWPKPLPNNWLLGSTIGVSVDSDDHVWIVHRGNLAPNEIPAALDPPFAEACCSAAPPILEFDQEGNLLQHWGGPGEGYDWPESNHGVFVDHMNNVWIGGNGGDDSHALKFSHSGEFLLQIGEDGYPEPDSNSQTRYQKVAKVTFDASANEAYLADGYGNKRVAVVDGDTGELKRYWGAYGNRPSDDELPRYDLMGAPAHGAVSNDKSGTQQFRNPVHCADPTNDGLVYACDRPGNRVQVFTKAGEFVEEIYLMTKTLGAGAVWDIAFSTDPDQTFAYVADGMNEKVHVLRRKPLEYIYSFGAGGRMAGQFYGNHSIAVDSKGNVYTTETYEGKRVQRFKYTGMGNAMGDVGVTWPDAGARNSLGFTEELEVNWAAARTHRRLDMRSWADDQRRVVAASQVPVLLPEPELPEHLDGALIFTGVGWYSASIKDDEHTVLITGTTRRVRVEGAEALKLPVLGEDELSLTRGEGIVEVYFMAFGAVYTISIECLQPDEDVRCTADDYALRLADSLLLASGSE